jgi:DNA-binding CsgD family transcriptional regulator
MTASNERDFDRLGKLLDRAVLDSELWPEVCDRLASHLGGVGAAFVPEDVGQSGPWIVASPALSGVIAQVFREGWHLRNFRRRSIPIIKQRGYATDLDIADSATLKREPFYAELLAPWRLGYFVGLNVKVGRQTWIAAVDREAGAAEPDEMLFRRVRRVLPALSASVRASFVLGQKRFGVWNDFLAEQSRGVFVLDCLGRVIDQNEVAETFLKRGLRLRNGVLQLKDAPRDGAFQRLIGAACAIFPPASLPPPVFWRDDDLQLLLGETVRVKPSSSFHTHGAALLVVRSVHEERAPISELLKRTASLTEAECRLAAALFEGHSLAEYASDAGNTVGTVRQQLKSIFRKTQTKRQAELVAWMRKTQLSDRDW